MLTIIGLGLRDGDIAQNGLDAIADVGRAYAELYTNAIDYDLAALEDRTGTPITVLERDDVEDADRIVTEAQEQDIVFLVSGDPLTATTHQDILFRARENGITTRVVHAPSILTAVAETGLSIYKFGRTTTLPAPYNGTVPDSPFDVIASNRENGLHTLLLLDIGMEMGEALDLVAGRLAADTDVVACSELGTTDRIIRYGTVDELREGAEMFDVPCSIIVPGDLSDNEQERLDTL